MIQHFMRTSGAMVVFHMVTTEGQTVPTTRIPSAEGKMQRLLLVVNGDKDGLIDRRISQQCNRHRSAHAPETN
ncbi:hypothetical protein L208DRAFT_1412193 [Tricholoma matsutake]|nr:hypothetical protein L208DRAFT_1412193 [Tricholoma matsutake 945]